MSSQHTNVAAQAATKQPVEYGITEADIAASRARFAALTCDSPKGYEEVRQAIAHCRTNRVAIEQRRKELKSDALEYGRRVDAVAKHLTSMITDIEGPLAAKKAAVDEAKAREKAAAEEAKRLAVEAQIRAEREAEEARLRAEREAEEARLREENARLEAERAKLAEERRKAEEAQRIERERIEAERAAQEANLAEERRAVEVERARVRAEREAAERAEFERQAKIRADAEAREAAERQRVAGEEARVAEAERLAAAKVRLDAIRPDAEKVADWAGVIRAAIDAAPAVTSDEARTCVNGACGSLRSIAGTLGGFVAEVGGSR